MKIFNRKNKLDEMQEQKLLKIEHNGYWLGFWLLTASIVLKSAFGKGSTMSESLILFTMCIYTLTACIKNGIWDRHFSAKTSTNVALSALTGLAMGALFFVSSYVKYHKIYGSIATGIIMFFMITILCFTSLTISSSLYKKSLKDIENKLDDE